jgi:hypothetical protein
MKPQKSLKPACKSFTAESLQLAKDLAKIPGPRRKVSDPVGTKTVLRPDLALVRTYTVQLVTTETLSAGFPFGLRINVEASTPQSAAEIAAEDFRQLADSIRQDARIAYLDEIQRKFASDPAMAVTRWPIQRQF